MHASLHRRRFLLLALAAAALGCTVLAGCAAFRSGETQLRPVSGKARSYDSAAISYRLSSPVRPSGEIQTVGYSQPAPGPTQYLAIEYPHPAGHSGQALCEVIVARDAAADGEKKSDGWLSRMRRGTLDQLPGLTYAEGIESAWALDVPIDEIDQIIHRLDQQGYFSSTRRPPNGLELNARINGVPFSKTWPAVPELNALVLRVRKKGKLVSHREPLPAATSPAGENSAVQLAAAQTPVAPSPLSQPSAAASPVAPALYTAPLEQSPLPLVERLPPVD